MAAYEAARNAYETAQRQEAELRAMLCAAEARAAQLLRDFDDAEAKLRNTTTDLSHTQSLCHSLESRIAEHARCQRSAVLLLAPPSSSISKRSAPPRLCHMDPYSLLHTPTGEAFAYDLVELRSCASADQAVGVLNGGESDDGSETESMNDAADAGAWGSNDGGDDVDAEANQLPSRPSITSLLTEAVRDVLHGYHYTLLFTSSDGCRLCAQYENLTNNVCPATAPSTSDVPAAACGQPHKHRRTCQPANLCLRLLQLLQREAARSGVRALSVTVAAGCVGAREAARIPGSGVTARTASAKEPNRAAATCGWTDLLLPAATRHQQLTVSMEAAPSEEREETALPSMPSDVWSMRGTSGGSAGAGSWLDAGCTHPNDRHILLPSTSSATAATGAPLTSHAPTLEGVPVSSIEAAAFWLREAGLLSTTDTSNISTDRVALKSPTTTSTERVDAQEVTADASVVVLLVGVDSQDATGKLHRSLLRIVSDTHFDPGYFAHAGPLLRSGSRGMDVDPPACCSPSTFALYMSHALGVVARAAAAKMPDAGDAGQCATQVSDEHDGTAASSPVRMLLLQGAEVAPLAACEIRAAAQSISLQWPAEVCASSPAARGHASSRSQLDAAWSLWAALLRPVFGGNSKALWLHCTNGDSRGFHDSAGSAPIPDGLPSPPVPRDDTAALRLGALFCRLVRHDAVASEVSPDLARLVRVRL